MPSWLVERVHGSAGEFHHRDLGGDRAATFFTSDRPTLVLGSAQPAGSVDAGSAARQGIDVVRRRSGGGGVLLVPGEHVWLDLEIPRTDRLWSDDVGRAMWFVGEVWQAALEPLVQGMTVHRGRLQRTAWSAAVCFSGLGPGEVVVGDAKLVGIAQRRTRLAARFQSVVHLVWRQDVMRSLLAPPLPTEPLTPVATCPAPAELVVARLTAALTSL
jgi:lipoate-protein ligase A